MNKEGSVVRFSTLTKAFICLVFWMVSAGAIFAIESPQQYFDYNPYYEPNVLGATDYKDYKAFGGYFLAFTKDLTPDSPLYFLKRMEENVALVLTTGNPVKRADALLAIGGERTSEIDSLAGEGKTRAIGSLVASYDRTMADQANTLESLKGKPEATPLMLETDKEVAKHMLTLEEVSLKVPEAASAHIQTAIAKAEEALDRVADVAGRPAVPQEMIARLAAYKAQGLLSEEEIAGIVSSSTRREARNGFRKLADARVVPLADVKKFDEAAASYYPEGFARAVEMRKFRELTSLEKDRPDEATVVAVQEFAKDYKAGDMVPPAIRSWWAPMVRLEELQATFRPDLLEAAAYFKYRPEEQQKYTELVERMKPTEKDMQYVQNLVATNPTAANDPAYSRVLMLGERFGTADQTFPSSPIAASCSRESHWVSVPFMPGGGYCVPDSVSKMQYETRGYPSPVSPPSYCPQGKMFREGKCEDYQQPPAEGCQQNSWWNGQKCIEQKNCGQGQYQDSNGECKSSADEYKRYESLCKDRPIPAGGCGSGWWDMASCSCVGGSPGGGGGGGGGGTSTESMKAACERGGCRWTGVGNACECPSYGGGGGGTPSSESQEAACRAGGGRCVSWVNGACGCERSTSGSGGGTYTAPSSYNPEEMCRRTPNCSWANGACGCNSSGGTSGGSSSGGGSTPPSCGSGYYWNGSSCAASAPQPSEPAPTSAPQPSSPPPASEPPPSSPPPPSSEPAPAPPPAESAPPPSP